MTQTCYTMHMRQEIERVLEQSTRKLLATASPPVRYWALTQVQGRDPDDPSVKEALAKCARFEPKRQLLSKLREDGTWPIPKGRKAAEDRGPGPPIGFTYRVILWNLYTLAEHVTSKAEGNVEHSIENILSWQVEDGHIPGPWQAGVPLPYFNGYALHDLLRFDMEKDERVQKLVRWLLSTQRADGGWNIPYMMDVRFLPKYKGMRMKAFMELVRSPTKPPFDPEEIEDLPSCTWSTFLVTWGLAESPQWARSKQVKLGCELYLDRFFKKNEQTSYYLNEAHWTKLRYPSRFGSGLAALDVLAKVGYAMDDPRMEKPLRWLLKARGVDGLWGQSTSRPHSTQDEWISLIALRTLSRVVDNRGWGLGAKD